MLLRLCAPNAQAQAPLNDIFADRITLEGSNVTITASNVGATEEPGEPLHWGRAVGTSVWWTWRAPAAGQCDINTEGSSFDTVLVVYVGSALTNLILLAGNDDHSRLPTSRTYFQTTSNTDYQIVVDGINGDSGNITLSFTFTNALPARPSNDDFANATVLSGFPVSDSGSNELATRELGEPLHAGQYSDASVWWSWTAPFAGTVTITTAGSDFDTTLGVYVGSSVTNLAYIAGNDDEDPGVIVTSAVTFDTIAGQTYRIAVDGFDDSYGQIALAIKSQGGSPGMQLTDPLALPDGNFRFTLTGPPGRTNEIDASPDFLHWTSLGTLVNTNGSVTFTDLTATNFPQRSYRAILQ